jgi:hypothetical protein
MPDGADQRINNPPEGRYGWVNHPLAGSLRVLRLQRAVTTAVITLALVALTLLVAAILLRSPGFATPLYSDSAQSVSNAPGP